MPRNDTEREVIVHEFENGRQWIRCRINTFRARQYLDLRVWFEPELGEPLRPTQKGISILAENLDELETAIAAFKEGLANGGRVRRTVSRKRDAA